MTSLPDITPATIARGDRGTLVVEVDGMALGDSPHLADAVHCLCEFAIRQQQALVVTVTSGSGKQYMSIDKTGLVSPAAAPAPRNVSPMSDAFVAPKERDLAHARSDEITSNQWVQRYILDPTQASPAPPEQTPPPRRRRGLFRRG